MRKKLIVSGCSFTTKDYVSSTYPDIDTSYPKWPELLAEKLDMDLVNLAFSGMGNRGILLTLLEAIERTPKDEMVLKSSGNSWVEIEDLDGNLYLTRLMRSGETFVVPDKKGLTLSTGNAGVLSLTFGSTHISKLGSVGEVISSS